MLRELRIRHYAVIEDLRIRLEPGLNVLTGETGAGKSIIVGALSLLLGERATADLIREGESQAVVEGVFDLRERPDLRRMCDERGIEVEDGLIVMKREVNAEGRNRAWINGSPVSATVVGEIGRALVDLHGQHEHQTLLRADEQRLVLDAYAGAGEAAAQVARLHTELHAVRREIAELEARRAQLQQRADFLRHQAQEIEAAGLRPDEDRELDELERRLSHFEELLAISSELHEAIYSGDEAIVARLAGLGRRLDALIRIDPSAAELREALESARYTLQDLGVRLGRYRGSVDHDPARLTEVRRRQDVLYRLKSKYGPTLADVIEAGRRARGELSSAEETGLELETLTERGRTLEVELAHEAQALSEARRRRGEALAREVTASLPGLGMPDGLFEVSLTPLAAIASSGAESVEFGVTVNRGFEPRPLARVASGGELSRIMLALKAILARLDRVPSLVFDEIDVGIGGIVALRVGETLKAVSGNHQVFVITHLPQIAARADHHVLVTKLTAGDRAAAVVEELSGPARVREVARLLGGDPDSEVSLRHARELLGAGKAVSPQEVEPRPAGGRRAAKEPAAPREPTGRDGSPGARPTRQAPGRRRKSSSSN
ncbi:MAG: DNA repair protein RecN [Gemmatimonadetes bacterium]|nr:DNA repair protein RecN [Gemmatimonadota bacterium]